MMTTHSLHSTMMKEILILLAFAAFVCAGEVEDVEQKKRGIGKPNNLNAIPTGVQKPDYTYIYSSNPNNPASSSYQPQVPHSYYTSQSNNQYYSSASSPTDTSSPYQQSSASTSHFVPLNFIPNPGYQSKYQYVPSKASNGNVQLAILPQSPSYPSPTLVMYPQSLFSPNQLFSYQNPLLSAFSSHGHFLSPNDQSVSLGNPYLGQASAMLVVGQPTALHNNLLYSNPIQSVYNPSNAQVKYSNQYGGSPTSSVEYEKLQGSNSQSVSKEGNYLNGGAYISSSDSSIDYKNPYAGSRSSSYSKMK